MGCRWWSAFEDGQPGRVPDITVEDEDQPTEFVQWSCQVRVPRKFKAPEARLVIRATCATANAVAVLEGV